MIQTTPPTVPGPASGPIAAARRPRRVTVLAVLIAIVSLILAGVIGEFRDAAATSTRIDASLNQTVDLVAGQTITLTKVSGGVSLGQGSSSGMTTGRFILLRIVTVTEHDRKLFGMTCRAVVDGQEYPVTSGGVSFPESGQRRTSEVVIEVPTEAVGRVELACKDSASIFVRAADVHFDFGLAARTQQFLSETAYATVSPAAPVIEGLP